MRLIEEAGAYMSPDGTDSNHWVVHLSSDDLSLGTYSIPAGERHKFTEISEDLTLIVVFAPPYESRAPGVG